VYVLKAESPRSRKALALARSLTLTDLNTRVLATSFKKRHTKRNLSKAA
jgi:hypothetical protein